MSAYIPQSPESEAALLGAMLESPAIIIQHRSELYPELFNCGANAVVAETVLGLADKGEEIGFLPVVRALRSTGRLEAVGGPSAVSTLGQAFTSVGGVPALITELRQHATQREIIRGARALLEQACRPGGFEDAQAELAKLATVATQHNAGASKEHLLRRVMVEVIEDIERAMAGKGPEYPQTGLPRLDEDVAILAPGTYAVLGGETSSGKTALALQLGRAYCAAGGKVGIASYEMPRKRLAMRWLAAESSLSMKAMRNGAISQYAINGMLAAAERLSNLGVYIRDEVSEVKVAGLRAWARELKAKYGVGMLIVDYIQFVPPTDSKAQREQQVAEVSEQLQKCAQELGICVLALSQLNADGQCRESKAIGQDADIVALIRMFEREDDKRDRWLQVTKNRDGEAPITLALEFDGARQIFKQAPDRPMPKPQKRK